MIAAILLAGSHSHKAWEELFAVVYSAHLQLKQFGAKWLLQSFLSEI